MTTDQDRSLILRIKELAVKSDNIFANWQDAVAFEFSSSFVSPTNAIIDKYIQEASNLMEKLEAADFAIRRLGER